MRLPSKVQISDLKSTELFVEGELTLETAEKIVGGNSNFSYGSHGFPVSLVSLWTYIGPLHPGELHPGER